MIVHGQGSVTAGLPSGPGATSPMPMMNPRLFSRISGRSVPSSVWRKDSGRPWPLKADGFGSGHSGPVTSGLELRVAHLPDVAAPAVARAEPRLVNRVGGIEKLDGEAELELKRESTRRSLVS